LEGVVKKKQKDFVYTNPKKTLVNHSNLDLYFFSKIFFFIEKPDKSY